MNNHKEKTCELCGEKYFNIRKHNLVCKKRHHGPHRWTDEEKKKLSEARKRYLKNNPDKHPWKKHSKFVSKPCEELKSFLREKGYSFEEEIRPVPNRYFSADIAFPKIRLIIEVNGNQHYNKDGKLSEYYQERHDLIESCAWKVMEIPYNVSYQEEFRMGLCSQLDDTLTSNQILCRFKSCQPWRSKKDKEKIKEARRQLLKKAKADGKLRSDGGYSPSKITPKEFEKRRQMILNSDVNLLKFGWLGEVIKITDLSISQIHTTLSFFSGTEKEIKVFKRKGTVNW